MASTSNKKFFRLGAMPGANGRGVVLIFERQLLPVISTAPRQAQRFCPPLTGGHFFAQVLVSFLCAVTVSGRRD
jgi:hypothetical protein